MDAVKKIILILVFFAIFLSSVAAITTDITVNFPTTAAPVQKNPGESVAVEFKYTNFLYPDCPSSYILEISNESLGKACSITILGDSWVAGYGYYGPSYACGFENDSDMKINKECALGSNVPFGLYDVSVEITDEFGNSAGKSVEPDAVRIGALPDLHIKNINCNGYESNEGVCNDNKIITGDIVSIEIEIGNKGTKKVEDAVVHVYKVIKKFSPGPEFEAADPLYIPVLEVDGTETIIFNVDTTGVVGEIKYLVVADVDGEIEEYDEYNNAYEIVVEVHELCLEGATRECGTDVGACEKGIETCISGIFQNCTAVMPSAEICENEIDDDCDGIVDRDCQRDSDDDSLLDEREIEIGTDPSNPDTDGDNVPDGQEVWDATDALNSLDNLLEVHYKKELMVNGQQEVSVTHPELGIIKGITVKVEQGAEYQADEDGHVRYIADAAGTFRAAVTKNRFSRNIEYTVLGPLHEIGVAISGVVEGIFGKEFVEQPLLLLLLLILSAMAAVLAYDASRFLFIRMQVSGMKVAGWRLTRVLISALFFITPLILNRLLGFQAAVIAALAEITVLVYIELHHLAQHKLKIVPKHIPGI